MDTHVTIFLKPNQKLGFTSDLHLFHKNIIHLANRPYRNLEEMHADLLHTHNTTFGPDDIIFNLGDAIHYPKKEKLEDKETHELLEQFNGKIYYLPGNHEKKIHVIRDHWRILSLIVDLTVKTKEDPKGQHIVLCHYPFRSWNRSHKGSWHLHGHTHAQLENDNGEKFQTNPKGLFQDVGIDTNNQKPYIYTELIGIMAQRTFKRLD